MNQNSRDLLLSSCLLGFFTTSGCVLVDYDDDHHEYTQDEDDSDEDNAPIGCGWGTVDDEPESVYTCGGEGEDPSGTQAYACPQDLKVGAACGDVTGVGCCDTDGNNWYCTAEQDLYQANCSAAAKLQPATTSSLLIDGQSL